MAYAPHTLVAFGGALNEIASGDEIWECTIRGYSPGGSKLPLSDPAGYMGQIHTALATWFGASTSGMYQGSTLKWLKVNNIGADGKYSDSTTNVYDYPSPTAGYVATQKAPAFCSVAMAWTTSRTRPPGAWGRIYPPNPSYAVVGSAIASADQALVVTAAKNLLGVLRNCSGSLGFIPVIASKVNATNTEITGVRVSDVYDVQRRRKNAALITYNASAWNSSCS